MKVEAFLKEWFNNELFISVKTSGSTGTPTTIELEKKKMVVSAKKTLQFLNIKPGSTALLCLSSDTIAGKMMIVRAIIGDLKLIVGSINSNPLKGIDQKIDFAALVPLQVQSVLEDDSDKLKNIQSCIIGGGPISQKLETELLEKGISVYHTFGMTETISHVAMRKAGYHGEPFFRALPGVHFSDQDSKLVIHYPEIGLENLQTTDIVHLTSDTSFEWIGRADFIINTGGVKINPEEVESALSSIIDVPFFITGIPDEHYGQKIILVIEAEKCSIPSKAEMNNHLINFALPKQVYFLHSFVRTNSGKINRIETVKLLQNYVAAEIL
jgi:O-succinylbenzoic acid--CoA ligase